VSAKKAVTALSSEPSAAVSARGEGSLDRRERYPEPETLGFVAQAAKLANHRAAVAAMQQRAAQ
jgi:hypothetical protein